MNSLHSILCFLALVASARAKCPLFGAARGGDLTCSNGNEVGSVCTVECNGGLDIVYEGEERTVTCLPGNSWDKPLPYCEGPCPPNAKADVVFVLDSSSSLRRVTRNMMKNFVKNMMSEWTISKSNVNVAIVPYNRNVVLESTVLLNQYPDDKKSILETLESLPKNGRGSMTANALNYVIEAVLSEENGNRPGVPDIVITMTDGRGQDNVKPPVEELQSMGVTLYAIGFHPKRKNMLPGQLLRLAGGDINRLHLTHQDEPGNYQIMMDDMKTKYCVDDKKPRCWPFPATPQNAVMECTEGDFLGSSCEISCDEGFAAMGDSTVECTVDNNTVSWTPFSASCLSPRFSPTIGPEISECENLGDLKHGEISCDDGKKLGSHCGFQCTEPGFQLYPATINQTVCTNGTWGTEKPCCARQCPPYAKMDAVLVLDSSSSVGEENWEILKKFVVDLVRSFQLGENGARFAVFRYNSFVDEETEIGLGDYTENIEDLLSAINDIPYNGFGTLTGQALYHARRFSLGVGERELALGNRPDVQDVVIVITDGWSADEVKEEAQQLRDAGVQTYGVAIQRSEHRAFNTDQIVDVAGSPDRMFVAEEGFSQLSSSFMATLINRICTKPCN